MEATDHAIIIQSMVGVLLLIKFKFLIFNPLSLQSESGPVKYGPNKVHFLYVHTHLEVNTGCSLFCTPRSSLAKLASYCRFFTCADFLKLMNWYTVRSTPELSSLVAIELLLHRCNAAISLLI